MSRIRAREVAFKALFQLDFNFEEENREAYENFAIKTMLAMAEEELLLTDKEIVPEGKPLFSEKNLAYIKLSVKGTRAHLEEIDAIITEHLKEGWQLSRIMAVDRNILRLATYEMKFVKPPLSKNIVINAAVELAKKYGTDDSGRFVNGILEAISK